ncbi:MAG: hypothetical protein AB1758_16475, partial [Candidatus Eremiobacterota bacterium]
YGQGAAGFLFVQPEREGWFRALLRDLLPAGLSRASWALHEGRVLDQDDREVRWQPAEQVLGLDGVVNAYLTSADYRSACEAATARWRFRYREG